jgi:ribonuclease Z
VEDRLHVYCLGTVSPALTHERQGISTLIKAGPHWLLFDTGRETLQRMFECDVPIADVTNIFYTHHDAVIGVGTAGYRGLY